MEFIHAKSRYLFLAEALAGSGGFSPRVSYLVDASNIKKPSLVSGACYIDAHPRESAEKYAARVACATYENHLLNACERFKSFLSRKQASRMNAESPFVQALLADADDAGNALSVFWQQFVMGAKARGSMLLLLDMPRYVDEGVQPTMADVGGGGAVRVVPYLVAIKPETVADYTMDDRGNFTGIGIESAITINSEVRPVIRRWDAVGWSVWDGGNMLESGPHPFGVCPVLSFTEDGSQFPYLGKYSQIADFSKRLMNVRNELDEILRSQTFSLLTLQIPPEVHDVQASIAALTATIGTHSLLVHQGVAPSFIAPDSGPAATLMARIEELRRAIGKIAADDAMKPRATMAAESGIARRMRFEALNADLAGFAGLMQGLENRMWALFHRGLGLQNTVQSVWPTDYNLTDTAAELDILALMMAGGFPAAVLREKRRAIVQAEFDSGDGEIMAELMAAINEEAQAESMEHTDLENKEGI